MKKLLLVSALTCSITFTSCTKCSKSQDSSEASKQTGTTAGGAAVTELKIETIKPGTGPELVVGKKVTVHYTGKIANGGVFDSSESRGAPFSFTPGHGQVLPGWDKGVEGMKVGERRRITIPPAMGYGEKGIGNIIPPNSTLVFEIELLSIE